MTRTISMLCALTLVALVVSPALAQDSPALPETGQDATMSPDSVMHDDAVDPDAMDHDAADEAMENGAMPGDAASPNADSFGDWDEDGDGMLDQEEFARTGFYDRWNTDAVEGLTRSEFGKGYRDLGFFDEWSGDEGRVVRDRFGFANDAWFTGWDRDASENLSRLEFAQGAFDTWDVNDDGLLDSNELNRGVLAAWDRDRSGNWNSDEWADASPWFDGTGDDDSLIRP